MMLVDTVTCFVNVCCAVHVFDEDSLEVIEEREPPKAIGHARATKPGGPRNEPPRPGVPAR